MIVTRILVPTDLTLEADKAIRFATLIARATGDSITFLHIHDDKKKSLSVLEKELQETCVLIAESYGVECDFLIKEGNIYTEIPEIARDACYRMMVVATHGIKGIKQKLLGASILKLVREIPVPVLVVQKDSPITDDMFRTILFPVGGHESFSEKINATAFIADLFNSEVHIYSVLRPGDELTDQMVNNVEKAIQAFESKRIKYKRVNETPSVYSVGFSKQTMLYAEKVKADLITIMSVPTKEHYYFAQTDKENILTNDLKIPVLSTSDRKQF